MKLVLSTILSVLSYVAISAPGDTTTIRVHDNVSMVWYQNYDAQTTFPDGGESWGRILLHYTMGCPSTGCSDWDYTTKTLLC